VWIHGAGELILPVSLAPRSIWFRSLRTPLGRIWVAALSPVPAAAGDQSIDFAAGHDLWTSIRAPLAAAFIQLGITSRFQPAFIGLVLPAHAATISKQSSSSGFYETEPNCDAGTNPSVIAACVQTKGQELPLHKGAARPTNSDALQDAHRRSERRRYPRRLQAHRHDSL